MAFAEGYVDVATRIVEFRTKFPDGSLQPANLAEPFSVRSIGDQTFIVVVAAAYRSAEDQRPGVGMAYEVFPGRTPYTKGSELQNAETSAWGRAIVAALAADTKEGIASAEEVRNRQAERDAVQDPDEGTLAGISQLLEEAATADKETLTRLWKEAKDAGWMHLVVDGGQVVKQLERLVNRIKAMEAEAVA